MTGGDGSLQPPLIVGKPRRDLKFGRIGVESREEERDLERCTCSASDVKDKFTEKSERGEGVSEGPW